MADILVSRAVNVEDAAETTANEADRLFGHFDPGLFGILSAPTRRAYARLLLAVYREMLRDGVFEGIQRDDIVEAIGRALEVEQRTPDPFAADSLNSAISRNPSHVYNQLRDSGWFAERREKFSIFVDFDVPVTLLLELFDEVESGAALNFTGTLMSIEGTVVALSEDPEARALSLVDCAARSRKFMQHLRNVVRTMRAFHRKVSSVRARSELVEVFFDQYVERMLISDYQSLATRNNPARYRNRVLALVREYEVDDAVVDALARGYVADGVSNPEGARTDVLSHLDDIRAAFIGSETQLQAIDAARRDIERRVIRSLTASSATDGGEISRIEAAMAMLDDRPPTIHGIGVHLVAAHEPIGETMLTAPRARRERPPRRAVVSQPDNPALSYLTGLKQSFLLRIAPSEDRLVEFIEAQLGDASSVEAADFVISDVRDFSLFRTVPAVCVLYPALESRYRVVFGEHYREDGEREKVAFPVLADNDWAEFPPFRLERVSPTVRPDDLQE